MTNNKSMVDSILEVKEELDKHDIPEPFRELTLLPTEYMRLRRELGRNDPGLIGELKSCFGMPVKIHKPEPMPPDPSQEEMDKLASALTEAVLQLRAGDIEGARATLNDADRLCDVRISAHATQVPDHYLDAVKYGMGMSHYQYQPEGPPQTATEQLMKQQIAERQMRQIMHEMDKNINSTLYPPHILSDNTTDPTDPTNSGV